ncbi:MAG: sulfurtransferase TusA family protein [Lachnospiraceae bacterium]
MKEVDARGLSCPEPLMMTAEALQDGKGKTAISTEKDTEFEIVIE